MQRAESTDGRSEAMDVHRPVALALSTEISRIHKQFVGRGPENVQTTLSGDVLVCLVSGGLTIAEQTLSKNGNQDVVAARRVALHDAMRQALVAAVEEVTGRRVRAFMSASDLDRDLQAEIFVFEADVLGPRPETPGNR